MKKRSLTKTLTIAFISISAIAILISSTINIYNNFLSTQKLVAKEQQIICKDASEKVKNYIQEKMILLASLNKINTLSVSDFENQKYLLGKILSNDTAIRQIAFVDHQNNELTRVSRLSKTTLGQLTDENKKEQLSLINSKESHISNVYVDEKSYEPIILITIAVKNENEKIGFIFAEVNLKFMWDLINTIKIGKEGTSYVVDRKGFLLAFGDSGRVIKGENVSKVRKVQDFINRKSDNDDNFYLSKGILDTYTVASYVPLVFPDWAVIAELPLDEAYSSVIFNIYLAVAALIVSLLISIVLGLYISRRITKPIISLKNATNMLSKGDLNTKINVKSKNEIGQLAADFNQMSLNISNLIVNIKQSINLFMNQSSKLKERAYQSSKSAEAVAIAMNQISDGTFQQAEEARKTTIQTQVLGDEIDFAVNKATEVEQITNFTRNISVKSKDTVDLLIQKAEETYDITKKTQENTKQLSSSLGKIRGIAEALSIITYRTQILSLNARIEAVKAGSSGNGFIVIVKEISKLAEKSRDTTKMIEPILEDIQLKTEASLEISEEANNIIDDQMKAVFSTKKTFDDIINSMDSAMTKILEMNNIIGQIENFKESSINSVMSISSITEETAASCQEVSSVSIEQKQIADEVNSFANSLYEMGENLVKITNSFKTREDV